MADFLFAPTPHEEAVAFIRAKPAVSRRVFDQLLPELKARAFTIAGIEHADVLQRVRDTIATLPAGGDWEQVKKHILAEVSPYLVTSDDPEERAKEEAAAERRAELLLRVHGQQAYAAASYRVMDAQRDLFPHWQYQTMGDLHVRRTHAALDKIVLPADSPFWATHFPPWAWGCRCQAIPLSAADVQEIQAADETRPPEARQALDEASVAKLERENILVRHADPVAGKGAPTPINVQSPAERGDRGAFSWQPGSLRMSLEELRHRYDPEIFAKFEEFARKTLIPELGQSVWAWLEGVKPTTLAAQADGSLTVFGPHGRGHGAKGGRWVTVEHRHVLIGPHGEVLQGHLPHGEAHAGGDTHHGAGGGGGGGGQGEAHPIGHGEAHHGGQGEAHGMGEAHHGGLETHGRKAPVSDSIEVAATGHVQAAAHHALSKINHVHDDGELNKVRLEESSSRSAHEHGTYEHEGFSAKKVTLRGDAEFHPELTATHEIGHYIHHQAFDFAEGKGGKFDADLEPWAKAAKQAASSKELARMAKTAKGRSDPVSKHISYLANHKEQFARDYSHYIAVRSGDQKLLGQIAKERADKMNFGHLAYRSEADFAHVAAAFDKIFTKKKWR